MIKRSFSLVCVAFLLLSQTAFAETSSYHLKKLEIQAQAFLAQLQRTHPETTPVVPDSTSTESQEQELEQQLETAVEAPTWAENMVREDIKSLLSTTATLIDQLDQSNKKDSDEYLKARVELESLARRLRVSTSPLELDPQQEAGLKLMMLELDEAAASLASERQEVLAQRDSRRRRRSNISIGLGYGGWGGGPWGGWGGGPWGAWGPFYGGGFYRRGFRRGFYRRGCGW